MHRYLSEQLFGGRLTEHCAARRRHLARLSPGIVDRNHGRHCRTSSGARNVERLAVEVTFSPPLATPFGVLTHALMRLLRQFWRPDGRLAVEHRPADVVPQPLVVEYELADRLRELVALPPALESPCALDLSFRRGGTCGLDRVGGRTELVRRDVCDGRGHCMAARRACLGHGDLAARPGLPEFDRATWPRVLRLSRLEEVKDVLRARCRP